MALVGSDVAAPRLPFLTDNNVLSSPAVANGVVYVGSQDSVDVNLYAINAATGAEPWSYRTGNFVSSSPTVANGLVYALSEDGYLYAFGL